jgi:hypothetical protein
METTLELNNPEDGPVSLTVVHPERVLIDSQYLEGNSEATVRKVHLAMQVGEVRALREEDVPPSGYIQRWLFE